jgi:hypothetical protein
VTRSHSEFRVKVREHLVATLFASMRLPHMMCSNLAPSADTMRLACRKHRPGLCMQVVQTLNVADQQDALRVQRATCPVVRHPADKSHEDTAHACELLSTACLSSAKAYDPDLERAEFFTGPDETDSLSLLHQAGMSEQPVPFEAPVWRLVRGPALSLFAIYALTLAIFPGFLSEVRTWLHNAARSVVRVIARANLEPVLHGWPGASPKCSQSVRLTTKQHASSSSMLLVTVVWAMAGMRMKQCS